jgi:hypothetical protein
MQMQMLFCLRAHPVLVVDQSFVPPIIELQISHKMSHIAILSWTVVPWLLSPSCRPPLGSSPDQWCAPDSNSLPLRYA